MKKIPLTRGLFALVDDDIFQLIGHLKWFALSAGKGNGFYAARNIPAPEKKQRRRTLLLHHIILPPKQGFQVDHKNQNKLDDQRENLRYATLFEQRRNSRRYKNCVSKYKGVSKVSRCECWQATIRLDGKPRYLGMFYSQEDAARAYDAAARKYFGEFACPNFTPPTT